MEGYRRHANEEIDAVYEEMFSWATTRGDDVYQAFSEAFIDVVTLTPAYGAYRDLIEDFIINEPIKIPSYQANKIYTAHQAMVASEDTRERLGFPELFVIKDAWLDWLEASFMDPGGKPYPKLKHLLSRTYNKNDPRRAVVPAFVAGIQIKTGVIKGRQWSLQENGSAGNLILKALAMQYHLSDEVTVIGEDGKADELRSANFNRLVRLALDQFGEGIGIEIKPPRTKEDRQWMKSCTLDPTRWDRFQFHGPYEDRYDALEAADHEKVCSVTGDFLDLDEEGEAIVRGRKADIMFSSHVMSQNRQRIGRLIAATHPRMRRSGVHLLNEYAVENPDRPRYPILFDRWYREEFACQTLASRADAPREGWFAVLKWRAANCEEAILVPEGLDRLAPGAVELLDRPLDEL